MPAGPPRLLPVPTVNESRHIGSWPISERPRERLFRYGPRQVSLTELLAILLGTGTKGSSVVDLARELLPYTSHFMELTAGELLQIRGISEGKAARILAAVEIGRRLTGAKASETPTRIRTSRDVLEHVKDRCWGESQEVFLAIPLTVKNEPLAIIEVARGGAEGVLLSPRDLFKGILRCGASGVICVHNHPSGDPTPSREDRELTRRLMEGANLLGVRFLDHVIVAGETIYSFADRGDLLVMVERL